jgi:hypothetical protein
MRLIKTEPGYLPIPLTRLLVIVVIIGGVDPGAIISIVKVSPPNFVR